MKRLLIALCGVLCLPVFVHAQLLTWTPDFAKESDGITITLDATKGNQGLNNYSDNNNIYVHIGVTTNLSNDGGRQWKYVNGTIGGAWGSATPGLKATYIGNNRYQYTISNIRNFFAVPAGETIQKIAILFRDANANADAVKKAANIDGSDMYIPVYDNSVAIRFTVPAFQPTFIPIQEPFNKSVNDNIALTAISNKSATLNLILNGSTIQTASTATTVSSTPTLTQGGNTTIYAEAIDGANNKRDSLKFFVSGGQTIAALPAGVRDGINYLSNTSVVLVLYAPNKNRVSVIGEFPGNNWTEQINNQMNKTPDGNYWWIQIDGLTAGTEYAFQYIVDGTLRVPDPYAEKILDKNNDPGIPATVYPNLKAYPANQNGLVSVLQTAAPAYTWKNNTFTSGVNKKNLIIYEVLLRDFTDAHSWQTMIDTIGYLQRLGINAVELMPVSEFQGNDSWGYNPSFSFAPDKYYGTKNKLKEFIDSCHSRNISVLMDVVPNHVYEQSTLAQLYWNAGANRPAADSPWLNQVQPHAFGFGYDFNHESAATKYYWKRVFDFWIREYKMDGYRMDFTKGLTQKVSTDDNQFSQYDQTRVDILRSYADTIWKNFPNAYIILEHLTGGTEEQALQNLGFLMWTGKGLNIQFNEATMGFHDNGKSNLSSMVYNSSERGFTNAHLVAYMESHDEERLMYKNLTYGNISGAYSVKNDSIALRRMEAAFSIFLAVPGPKMIWQFGERGYDKSIFACVDGSIPQPYGTNESCKLTPKEPRWQYMGVTARKRLYDITSALIKFRNTQTTLFNSTDFSYSLVNNIKWFKIAEPNLSMLVVANFDVVAANASVTFQSSGTWYDYLSGATVTATGSLQTIPLQPGEYHVYVNKNLTNVVTTPVTDIPSRANDLQAAVWPNPVSTASLLELNVPATGNINIEAWHVDGRKMGVVFSGMMTKGIHRLTLSDKLNKLAAGVYLLNVRAAGQSQTLKLVMP